MDAYLADDHPMAGPLFLNAAGTGRLPYIGAYKSIRRLARTAAIPAAGRVSRRSCATPSSPKPAPPTSR